MGADITGQFGLLFEGLVTFGKYGITILIAIAVLIFTFIWTRKKKSFDIPVTILIPRSDGKIVDQVTARGGYFTIGGAVVFKLRRRKAKTIAIPPPSSSYLVGLSRHLYLAQKGFNDYTPVNPNSLRFVDVKGKTQAILKLKAHNQQATMWGESWEAMARKQFSITTFLEKYGLFMAIGLVLFIMAIGFYINWGGMREVVDAINNLITNKCQ